MSLTIRPATLTTADQDLFIDFKDSQLKWLSAVGSTGQWGTKPAREENPTVSERSHLWVERSERHAPWGDDWCRAFVAEAASSGAPLAGLVLESKAPAHLSSFIRDTEQDQSEPFVYLAYLISNRNVGEERKGVGAALIALAKEETRGAGLNRLCLDCWRGNDRKLVR